MRKWKIEGNDESAVIAFDEGTVSTTFIGLLNLGKITVKQLQELERKYPAQTSLTEESEMFHIQAKDVRQLFPTAGKGAVGFIPVKIPDDEYMVLIAENASTPIMHRTFEEDAFELWWVHLYIE